MQDLHSLDTAALIAKIKALEEAAAIASTKQVKETNFKEVKLSDKGMLVISFTDNMNVMFSPKRFAAFIKNIDTIKAFVEKNKQGFENLYEAKKEDRANGWKARRVTSQANKAQKQA